MMAAGSAGLPGAASWLSPFNPAVVVGLGALLGCGAALILARLPFFRRPTLLDRMEPYLRDQPRPSALLDAGPGLRWGPGALIAPWLADAGRWLERRMGGTAGLRARLERLGTDQTPEAFRAQQVVWGAGGLLAGIGLAWLLSAARGFSAFALIGILLLGTAGGLLLPDRLLTSRIARREALMLTELPTVAELLALAVTAGEGPVGALERVVRTCRGELSRELERALAQARTGTPLVDALDALGRRTPIGAVARFVDGIAVALERGTPLAEVLRAQAADIREGGRRELMEEGGKKEIAMLVPVVLFVLPITVVFAIFPSLAVLDLGGG